LVTFNGYLSIFDLKLRDMDDIPFYKRPWFYITSWLVFLLVVYFWQIYRMGGVQANKTTILQDLFCILPIFFVIWMAFFSQFVLPINRFRDRQRIFDRLFRHLFGNHGPALFIENGDIREHSGERLKRGPGVVWLDSASAAVTRTATAIKKTIGPGVHFTDANEYIEKSGTLDLHMQSQRLGPRDRENPFEERKGDQSPEQYEELQGRRRQVSALTRDGIELVPDISVTFRVNTGFPAYGEPGSRFGYRTGSTPEAKILEKQDQDVITQALLGEGVNPNMGTESTFHRVAWNRIPAMLAVDVWREYASKFTLDEIFNPTQEPPSAPQKPNEPTEQEIAAMRSPTPAPSNKDGFFTRLLRSVNNSLEKALNSLERRPVPTPPTTTTTTPPAGQIIIPPAAPPSNRTALQVINELLKARLTQPRVDLMDEDGIRKIGQLESKEYDLLQMRGLKVISVSVSNVRVHPTIQESLIKQWKANWLKFAIGEGQLLDFKRNLVEVTAQDATQISYAIRLSKDINLLCKKGKPNADELLKVILLRSRAMIRSGEHSNVLRRRMTTELQDIEDAIKWLGEDEQ
jgi:hypothetical protein